MPCNGFLSHSLPFPLSLSPSPLPLFTVNLRLTPIPPLQQLQCGSRAGLLTLDQNSAKKKEEVAPGNGLVSHQSYACVMQTVSQEFQLHIFVIFRIYLVFFVYFFLALSAVYAKSCWFTFLAEILWSSRQAQSQELKRFQGIFIRFIIYKIYFI